MSGRAAGYQRRADEWVLQANLAARELSRSGDSSSTSILAEQAAQAEYESAKQPLADSSDVLDFMQTKFTNEQLYGWLQGQLSNLYYQYYRLALDLARKAEQTMKWELMRPEVDATTYVQPNYWDSGHQGLASGEALTLDLRRMEADYHTYNTRELELTRHVSLRQLDPLALLELKITGACSVSIPEWLYDRDCPGHYMRRIKTVAVSIPSVVGPYTSVNCTLTLQNSSVRISPGRRVELRAQDATATTPASSTTTARSQSIVTSGAMFDSGMFETNLRDERFLPFEGAGAISTWTLALPPIPASTTRRSPTSSSTCATRPATPAQASQRRRRRRFSRSLRQCAGEPDADAGSSRSTFVTTSPSEWYAFTVDPTKFSASLTTDRFPYIVQGTTITIASVTLYGNDGGKLTSAAPSAGFDHTALTTLSTNLTSTGSCTLEVAAAPELATILTPDARDVYLVLAYTAHR